MVEWDIILRTEPKNDTIGYKAGLVTQIGHRQTLSPSPAAPATTETETAGKREGKNRRPSGCSESSY